MPFFGKSHATFGGGFRSTLWNEILYYPDINPLKTCEKTNYSRFPWPGGYRAVSSTCPSAEEKRISPARPPTATRQAMLATRLIITCIRRRDSKWEPAVGRQLFDLKKAYDSGAITDAEYAGEKAKLLNQKQ